MKSVIFFFLIISVTLNDVHSRPDKYDNAIEEDILIKDEIDDTMVEELGDNNIIKAKVSLYMESLCPGCHYFIKKQLSPVYMKYYKYIQLDLLPYGNAQHMQLDNGSYAFSCQHGKVECFGNLYLACATEFLQVKRPKHLMRYYECMASTNYGNMQKDVHECAKKSGINFYRLEKCANSAEGEKYLAKIGDRTNSLSGRKFVPTVVVDDDFKIQDEDSILSDFFGYLCQKLKGKKPSECKSSISKEKKIDFTYFAQRSIA